MRCGGIEATIPTGSTAVNHALAFVFPGSLSKRDRFCCHQTPQQQFSQNGL